MPEFNDRREHTTSIGGFRYQGEGTYNVKCSCGKTFDNIAYHKDAKRTAAAHVAQAAAGIPDR